MNTKTEVKRPRLIRMVEVACIECHWYEGAWGCPMRCPRKAVEVTEEECRKLGIRVALPI